MTEAPQPRANPGVGETLRAAATLMRDHPRETMLPLLAVQAPLVVGTILLTLVLYGTVFTDEIYPRNGIIGASGSDGQRIVLVVVVAVALIAGLIGQAATIVAVGAAARGERFTISQALDPAFTRLGGLILITILFTIGAGVLAFTLVGLLAIPYLVARLGLTYQVYLLEATNPLEAISGSWRATRGSWQVFPGSTLPDALSRMLRLLAIVLVGVALLLLIGLLVPVSPGPDSASRGARMLIDAILQIMQGGVSVPVTVFAHTAVTLYYLRIREERPSSPSIREETP